MKFQTVNNTILNFNDCQAEMKNVFLTVFYHVLCVYLTIVATFFYKKHIYSYFWSKLQWSFLPVLTAASTNQFQPIISQWERIQVSREWDESRALPLIWAIMIFDQNVLLPSDYVFLSDSDFVNLVMEM